MQNCLTYLVRLAALARAAWGEAARLTALDPILLCVHSQDARLYSPCIKAEDSS